MQKNIQDKLRQLRKDKFLIVVDFAGTLFALGPDKDHIKDDFIPKDAEYLSGKRAIKGATELDPRGYKYKKPEPFQKGVRYGWTVIPSVAKLLQDIKGINIIASSVADQAEQVSLQKMAFKDNHIRINHIMTKDKERIAATGYRPSTIVVLGDTSKDVELAEDIANKFPNAKVICGFTPSGMEQHKAVQEVLNKQHPVEFISGETWSIVIKKLRKRLPLRSHHLHQFKKFRKQKGHLKNKSNFPSVRHGR